MNENFSILPFLKSKTFKIIVIILSIVLVLTLVGPLVVLAIASQPAVTEHAYSDVFFTSYEEVRANLNNRVKDLKSKKH